MTSPPPPMTTTDDAATAGLTDPDIDVVLAGYVRQMARFEEAALLVERRLRRELRANAIRSLLSSRAKHPEDLREKLTRKRTDSRYVLSALRDEIDRIVTDLAGCRVMVYQRTDVEKVRRLVREAFELAPVEGNDEAHDKATGYWAHHLLVHITDLERASLRNTICEIQITALGSHVFNELEHDVAYKAHGVPPSAAEEEALKDLRAAARLVDRAAERLLFERAETVATSTAPLRDAEDLQYALEQAAGRKLHGEFLRLFRFLDGLAESLTAQVAVGLAGPDVMAQGAKIAAELGLEPDDDVVCVALGIHRSYPDEIERFVRSLRGRATLLKKAVETAAERRQRP